MILVSDPKMRKAQGEQNGDATRSTIETLFERAVRNRPQDLAIADAPNRSALTGGTNRALTYAETNRMVNAIAAQLQAFGLATDSVVALFMPTAVEQTLALMGVLRAGLIPAPVPVGWGRRELADYIQTIGARAIITLDRSGSVDTADIARYVAADSFSVRFVLAFGQNVPDGVISIDHLWFEAPADLNPIERPNNPADHVAIITADATPDGIVAVPRSHSQLIAAGIATFIAARPMPTSIIAATLSLDTLAGLATQFVPWLVSASTLIVHPPFSASVFRMALFDDRVTHAILPVSAISAVLNADEGHTASLKNVVLVARRWADADVAISIRREGMKIIPLFVLGEAGLLPIAATSDGARLPLGQISFMAQNDKGAPIIMSRIGTQGQLEVSGAMVATHAYPPGIDRGAGPAWRLTQGFSTTGFEATADKKIGGVTLGAGRTGLVCIGSRAFPETALRQTYADLGGAIAPVVKADPVLGQRVTGVVGDGRAAVGLANKLEDAGLSQLLVPGATRYGGRIPFDDTGPDDVHATEGEKSIAQLEEHLQRYRAAGF